MNKITFLLLLSLFSLQQILASNSVTTNQPDSVYLFSYSLKDDGGHSGLHFAYSTDHENWVSIGPNFRFLFCDYGRWGKEKRLVTPFLFQTKDGIWHCVWSLNEYDGTFAHAESKDLLYWYPQSYPIVMTGNNCLEPEISYNNKSSEYKISWISDKTGEKKAFYVTTADFKNYSDTKEMPLNDRLNSRKEISILGKPEMGTIHKVSWDLLDGLMKKQQLDAYRQELWSENAKTDPTRFSGLKNLDAIITVDNSKSKKISDMLVGVFFEDINYAADGGLYAELVQNRDFEYAPGDKEGNDKTWNSHKAWHLQGDGATFTIDSLSPVHPNNPHFAVLKIEKPGAGLVNDGWDGISLKAGDKYNFSVFARNPDKKNKKLLICLTGKNGENYGETIVSANSSKWKKFAAVITADKTVDDAELEIIPQSAGTVDLDMISLFPQKTFKGHPNGLRADLAQTIADIHPKFIRFPGGCVAHGDGIGNIYRWKNTIGPLEARKPQRNLWGYHQSAGLGYYEYFQFCEDIGAQPVPVLAAGVPCQNSATGGPGQQCGIPMDQMDSYIQDILDLIEWANGDIHTKWGKIRAEEGHPKPFNLKSIGIGNEDLITDVFAVRYKMIYEAIKKQHPEITVIGTVGPTFEGTDYTEGWKIATKLAVPIVDEHYYQSPGWFIYNQDFYDKYDRNKAKVYLGEYASWGSTVYNALSEALYLASLERNGDIVHMASYAPLLAKKDHTQWNPDLIYFSNTEVKPTVNYFVQKLYGNNSGDIYLPCQILLSDKNEKVDKRFAVSVVRDTQTNDMIVKMVNLLPVEINAKVNLGNVGALNPSAVRTVLTGTPDDQTARPVTDNIAVSTDFPCTLPANSFTVIRIKPE